MGAWGVLISYIERDRPRDSLTGIERALREPLGPGKDTPREWIARGAWALGPKGNSHGEQGTLMLPQMG